MGQKDLIHLNADIVCALNLATQLKASFRIGGTMKLFSRTIVWLTAVALIVLSHGQALAETAVGSNMESRVVLALKVDDAKATATLPDGWKALTLPKGPFAGANLLVLFADRHLGLDPEGKPIAAHNSRYAALVSYGVSPDVKGAKMFVTQTYEVPPVVNVYGKASSASITRDVQLSGTDDGPRTRSENWTVEAQNGDKLTLNLSYEQGRFGWSSGEAMPYSATTPDFHRIYRYDQLIELASSAALDRKLNGEISFEASGPAMFDGSEEVRAITVIPMYIRNVFLP